MRINNDPKTKKVTKVMTKEQVSGAKASYEATTGKKYVPKKALPGKEAPRVFKNKAEKEAWMAKNRKK